MTTQVYYRKWRPQRLADLVGQEAVVRTLKQGLVRKRIGHAYLFCGPRGTGKTSTARILAKAVNCLAPQEDGEPCNACRLCMAVNEGRALDLVEIDAASNRGIDEVRNIREKVHYVPAESRYKVYVLDEAHELTGLAADALLKTLEEPPGHVIFVLATTEPDRLPATITSRCQRFDFHRIAPGAMVRRLAALCADEGIQAEPAALQAIAQAAGGSLRDAENLLEQAAITYGSPVALEQLRLLLGVAGDQRVLQLAGHLLHGKVREALLLANQLASEGIDVRQLHLQLLAQLRDLLLLKAGARDLVAQTPDTLAQQQSAIEGISPERLLRVIRLLSQAVFRLEAPTMLPLELAAVECGLDGVPTQPAHQEAASQSVRQTDAAPRLRASPAPATAPTSAAPGSVPSHPQPPTPAPSQGPVASAPAPLPPPQTGDASPSTRLESEWQSVVKALAHYKGRRFNVGSLLRACRGRRLEGDTLVLEFTHQSHKERMQEEMENPESRRAFLEVVAKTLGLASSLKLAFTAPNGPEPGAAAQESPLVQAALRMGAKVLKEENEEGEA